MPGFHFPSSSPPRPPHLSALRQATSRLRSRLRWRFPSRKMRMMRKEEKERERWALRPSVGDVKAVGMPTKATVPCSVDSTVKGQTDSMSTGIVQSTATPAVGGVTGPPTPDGGYASTRRDEEGVQVSKPLSPEDVERFEERECRIWKRLAQLQLEKSKGAGLPTPPQLSKSANPATPNTPYTPNEPFGPENLENPERLDHAVQNRPVQHLENTKGAPPTPHLAPTHANPAHPEQLTLECLSAEERKAWGIDFADITDAQVQYALRRISTALRQEDVSGMPNKDEQWTWAIAHADVSAKKVEYAMKSIAEKRRALEEGEREMWERWWELAQEEEVAWLEGEVLEQKRAGVQDCTNKASAAAPPQTLTERQSTKGDAQEANTLDASAAPRFLARVQQTVDKNQRKESWKEKAQRFHPFFKPTWREQVALGSPWRRPGRASKMGYWVVSDDDDE